MVNWLGVAMAAAVVVNVLRDLAWLALMWWAFRTASVRDFEVFSEAVPPPPSWARGLSRWNVSVGSAEGDRSQSRWKRIRSDP